MTWMASDFARGEFALKRNPPPAQTGRMTKKKLAKLVRDGYGQGHFQDYKPWLRVTKRDYSPNSIVGHLPAAGLARLHHYRAWAERCTIQVAKWLGAADVREAYPAWPWEHPHPGYGLPGFEDAPRLPGLLEVARQAEIKHGNFTGTNIPYVATIDEMVTWKGQDGRYFLVAFENKPEERCYEGVLYWRDKERLELIRRYCLAAGIAHRLIHAELLPPELIVNLDLLEPKLTGAQQSALTQSSLYLALVDELNTHGHERAMTELVDKVQQRTGVPDAKIQAALHMALWLQDVDHDLRAKHEPPTAHHGRAQQRPGQFQPRRHGSGSGLLRCANPRRRRKRPCGRTQRLAD